MKKHLLFLLLVIFVIPAFTLTLQEAIGTTLDSGSFMDREGDTVFMSNTYTTNEFTTETEAYEYLTEVAYEFFMIQTNWEEITDADQTSLINSVDYIATPYLDGELVYILHIPMSDLITEFDNDEYYFEIDPEDFYYDFEDFISYYAEITPLEVY